MEIRKEKLLEGIKQALADKGKRKFKQTMEIIVNFKGIDFTKPENRINAQVLLPHGKGKPNKVVVIADENTVYEAKKLGVDAFTVAEVEELAKDKKKAKKFVKSYDIFLVQPQLIGQVAKAIGRFLGQAGKAPKPLTGALEKAIEQAQRTITIKSKGKYMPVLQAPIGNEDYEPEKLLENAEAVLEAITKKVLPGNIKNIYFKLTMGKPVKVA